MHTALSMTGHGSAAERFLAEFHAARPGLTSSAFGALPVVFRGQPFSSSYAVLAQVVPQSDTPVDVLDLACGDGSLLSLLAARRQAGLSLTGVDMSGAELALAQSRLGAAARLQQAMAQSLPFAPGTVDVVLCQLALMLMDDTPRVLDEVRRVLKRGGTLAAVVDAMPPPSVAFTSYLDVLSRHPRQQRFADVRFGDRRWRDLDGIADLLSPAFRQILVEDMHVRQRLTPGALWRWLLDMYDLHLLSDESRDAAGQEFLEAVAPHCAPDGTLEHPETLRLLMAISA